MKRILFTFSVAMITVVLTAVGPALAGAKAGAGTGTGTAASANSNDWPCPQRFVPEISIGTVWTGPSVDPYLNEWWKNKEVFALVDDLMENNLDEKAGITAINSFAKGLGKDRKKILTMLVAGLFQKVNSERSHQLRGIRRFVDHQRKLTDRISALSAKKRALKKEGVKKADPGLVKLDEDLTWTVRIFDERDKLTPYICEEPVLLEQKLGALTLAIQANMKK